MRKKAVQAVAVIGITAALFAGCGKTQEMPSVPEPETTEQTAVAEDDAQEDAQAPAAEAGNEAADSDADTTTVDAKDANVQAGQIVTLGEDDARLRAGMVTDRAGVDDHSFFQSAWDGFTMLNDSIGARVSYVCSSSDEEIAENFEKLAADGNQICWGVGYNFADAVLEAAKKHPELNYGIVDYAYDEVPENVTCATFRSEEPSFLVGYLAAAVSKTGKIGYIGGMETETLEPFQYGFMAGAAMADKEKGTNTQVEIAFLESFEDPAAGKEKAAEMYAGGCDVIFHAAGGSGDGVIEAAKEADKFVIGVDGDQSYLAPENVLTSAIKKVNVVVSNISVQYSIQDNIGGKAIEYGISEYAMGIPTEHPNYSDELYDEVMELQNRIISFDVEVPSDKEEYDEFLEELKSE